LNLQQGEHPTQLEQPSNQLSGSSDSKSFIEKLFSDRLVTLVTLEICTDSKQQPAAAAACRMLLAATVGCIWLLLLAVAAVHASAWSYEAGTASFDPALSST